jgi:hypothetical protein
MNRRRLGEWIVSRSAKPHYRNRVDASVFRGERETPAADDVRAPHPRDATLSLRQAEAGATGAAERALGARPLR